MPESTLGGHGELPSKTVLPNEDFDALVASLDEPPQPVPALVELFRRRRVTLVPEAPADAPPNGCRDCGILERDHLDWHLYVEPTNALRLARMKVRRAMRLDPPRRAELTPDLIVEFQVNTGVFTAAIARAMEGLSEATRRMGEAARPVVESIRRQQLIAAMNRRADARIEAWRVRRETGINWGEPLEDSDADWPARGAVNEVCAHVCGGGPGHACEARAETFLQYALPSGGTRDMPICRPCYDAETAEVAHAQA